MNAPTMDDILNAVAPYEPAARIYCSMFGVAPDAEDVHPHPLIAGATVTRKRWTVIAARMVELSGLLTAMKIAKEMGAAANDAIIKVDEDEKAVIRMNGEGPPPAGSDA